MPTPRLPAPFPRPPKHALLQSKSGWVVLLGASRDARAKRRTKKGAPAGVTSWHLLGAAYGRALWRLLSTRGVGIPRPLNQA